MSANLLNEKEFVDMFGWHPIDMFGPDWENHLTDLSDEPTIIESKDLINEEDIL